MTADWSLMLILPELILAAAGIAVLSAGLWIKDARRVGRFALISVLLALAALSLLGGRSEQIWSDMVMVDGFANFFKVVFLVIAGLVILSSFEYVARREIPAGEFYSLVLFATLGMSFMAGSLNLLTIYLGLEALSLASYALAGILKGDARSTEASIKYILIGALTSSVILFGMSLVFGMTGSTNLAEIAAVVAAGNTAGTDLMLIASMIFLVVGFGVKIAAVPFHMWAPDVYEGSPTPISAWLITGSEAAAFAALLRIFLVGLPDLRPQWTIIFAVIAVATMTYGNITAIVQTRVKRMLAYSAIGQAGYITVGLAVATDLAVSAMLYYLLAYAFMTIGAFAVLILLKNQQPTEDITDFRGLSQRSPLVAAALTLYLLSLIGVPPTAGFFGKFFLVQAAVEHRLVWLAVVVVLNSVVSLPYYFNIVRNMYLRETEEPAPVPAPSSLRWVLGITLAGTLLLGLFPDAVIRLVTDISAFALNGP